mgnify:CR=1 FL=1
MSVCLCKDILYRQRLFVTSLAVCSQSLTHSVGRSAVCTQTSLRRRSFLPSFRGQRPTSPPPKLCFLSFCAARGRGAVALRRVGVRAIRASHHVTGAPRARSFTRAHCGLCIIIEGFVTSGVRGTMCACHQCCVCVDDADPQRVRGPATSATSTHKVSVRTSSEVRVKFYHVGLAVVGGWHISWLVGSCTSKAAVPLVAVM